MEDDLLPVLLLRLAVIQVVHDRVLHPPDAERLDTEGIEINVSYDLTQQFDVVVNGCRVPREIAEDNNRAVRLEGQIGLHGASAAEVVLRHVRVPREHRLGVDTAGRGIARRTLEAAGVGVAAQSVGIATAALEDALAYGRERRAFGHALVDFQTIQWRLADMATAVEAARLLTLEAAFLQDLGLPHASQVAMARLVAAETAMTLATQAVQVHGGYGYTREFAVERYFRDAATLGVAAELVERERLAIAERLLGGAAP